jgi:ribosomal protein S18 acetylase RimI-like enzyme
VGHPEIRWIEKDEEEERARCYARAARFDRPHLHADLDDPLLRRHSRFVAAFEGERLVGLASVLEGVFEYRSVPVTAELPGVAAELLSRVEPPFVALVPEPLWCEAQSLGGGRLGEEVFMARLVPIPLPDPDPRVERITDLEALRPLAGTRLAGVQLEVGPFLGVRDGDGRLAAMGGVHFVTDLLGQLAFIHTRPDARGSGLGRAIVIELIRALENGTRHVSLHVRPANRAAVQLYASLGFRGLRRFAFFSFPP